MLCKLIFIIIIAQAFPIFIWPCSCIFSQPSDAFQQADLVFVGLSIPSGEDSLDFDNPGPKMLFKIQKLYKGNQEDEVQIWSNWTNCGIYFPSGYRYLIYAYKSKDGTFNTSFCSRSKILSDAEIDLVYLDDLPDAFNKSSIVGHIYDYADATKDYWDLPPFADIKVTISNTEKIYETNTDKEGLYKFLDIDPGVYLMSFGVSKKYIPRFSFDNKIEINKGEFFEVDQTLVPNGIISGNLTDINGKPLSRILVEIIATDTLVNTSSYFMKSTSYVDSTGFFHFDRIPPGDYYLGINIRDRNPITLKYIQAYYPSVEKIGDAQIIRLAFGDSIGGLHLKLPSEKGIFYLKGKVLFEDSTLRVRGKVQLRTSSDLVDSELIEESTINVHGNFSMILLDGMEGWIHIIVESLSPKSENNPAIVTPDPFFYKAQKDEVGMEFIIRKQNESN